MGYPSSYPLQKSTSEPITLLFLLYGPQFQLKTYLIFLLKISLILILHVAENHTMYTSFLFMTVVANDSSVYGGQKM
jgi:hypothetical protein